MEEDDPIVIKEKFLGMEKEKFEKYVKGIIAVICTFSLVLAVVASIFGN